MLDDPFVISKANRVSYTSKKKKILILIVNMGSNNDTASSVRTILTIVREMCR